MTPPPIQVFLTTIASQPALRQRQEYLLRILQVKKIPFTSYDLASDEDAKRLWKRKAPAGKQQLPGILIGDSFPGTFQDFEDAVEFDELDTFLRRNEDYTPFADDAPAPEQKPIGVPGVATPLQMTPERLKPHLAAPARGTPTKGMPVNKRADFDIGEELSGYGLQGVRVTDDELSALVQELGIGGDDAKDLVKGLSGERKDAEGVPSGNSKDALDEAKTLEKEKPSDTSDRTDGGDKTEDQVEKELETSEPSKDAEDIKAFKGKDGKAAEDKEVMAEVEKEGHKAADASAEEKVDKAEKDMEAGEPSKEVEDSQIVEGKDVTTVEGKVKTADATTKAAAMDKNATASDASGQSKEQSPAQDEPKPSI